MLASAAGAIALGAGVEVSAAEPLPVSVSEFLTNNAVLLTVESTEDWHRRAKGMSVSADGVRFRVLGEDPVALAEAIDGSIDVGIYSDPLTPAGHIELLPYIQEQAISATNHRFGNRTSLLEGVLT